MKAEKAKEATLIRWKLELSEENREILNKIYDFIWKRANEGGPVASHEFADVDSCSLILRILRAEGYDIEMVGDLIARISWQ